MIDDFSQGAVRTIRALLLSAASIPTDAPLVAWWLIIRYAPTVMLELL